MLPNRDRPLVEDEGVLHGDAAIHRMSGGGGRRHEQQSSGSHPHPTPYLLLPCREEAAAVAVSSGGGDGYGEGSDGGGGGRGGEGSGAAAPQPGRQEDMEEDQLSALHDGDDDEGMDEDENSFEYAPAWLKGGALPWLGWVSNTRKPHGIFRPRAISIPPNPAPPLLLLVWPFACAVFEWLPTDRGPSSSYSPQPPHPK